MLRWELLDFCAFNKDYFQKYEVGSLSENTLNTASHVWYEPLTPFHEGKPCLNQEPNHDSACRKFVYRPLTLLWAGVREAKGLLSVG